MVSANNTYEEEYLMSEMDTNVVTVKHDEFGEIRHLMIDDEPWFVLADVCRVLEVGNVGQAATYLDDDEKQQVNSNIISNDVAPGGRDPWIISESGLYSTILRSRKPEAKRFKKWVTGEVLPQIRKTGQYARSKSALELLRDEVDRAIEHERRMNQIETRQDAVEVRVAEVAGDLEWYSAQGWAKLCGHQADQDYLRRVGMRAGKLVRQQGMEPGKAPHPVHASVNTYPPDVLREAFIQVN